MIFLALATVSMILVNPSKSSFSYSGLMSLLFANSARPNSYSAFIWGKTATEMRLRTCISEGLEKHKPKDLVCFKSYRKLHLSVVLWPCYHWFPQIAHVELCFACLLLKLCHLFLNSFVGWVSSWSFSHSIPFTTTLLLMLLTLCLTKYPAQGNTSILFLGAVFVGLFWALQSYWRAVWEAAEDCLFVTSGPSSPLFFFPWWLQLGYATAPFFMCATMTCGIDGICWDRKASGPLLVLRSGCPELLRHPEHHHMGISQEGSEREAKTWPRWVSHQPCLHMWSVWKGYWCWSTFVLWVYVHANMLSHSGTS